MNLIADLLPVKETYNLDDINDVVVKLDDELDICLKEVSSTLISADKEIQNHCESSKSHIVTLNEYEIQLSSLEKSLGDILLVDLKTAENSLEGLVTELDEVNSSISHVHVFCEIHNRLDTLKETCRNHTDYMKIVELMDALDKLIDGQPCTPSIPFIISLKQMVEKAKVEANTLLRTEFFNNCSLIKENNSFSLKIIGKDSSILHSILPAINKNQATHELISSLPKLLWEHLILPLILYQCEILEVITEEHSVVRVEVKNKKDKNQHEEVFRNISVMIDYFTKYFNCKLNDQLNLLSFIGSSLKDELSKTIMMECVSNEIPRDWMDIPKFKQNLIGSIEQLEDKLRGHGFIDTHWDWINNIEEIYGEKKSRYFSEKAKLLMKKDLHNMIEVGVPYDGSKAFTETDEILQCSISTYIPELIKLGDELINEISEGPHENTNILFTTYKGIFFNYGDFVASHHQKLLETIPQQVALFHNNCMYLYKQLQKWDDKFESNEILKDYYHDPSTKQFYQVEEVGRIFFDSFVREQKEQIEIILRGTNLHTKKTLENLEDNAEKLVRQCLRQQELLKTVWSKVLSYPVYNQTIGDILNTMCNFLITSLVALEDIGAVVAENLKELFKIITNRGVKLFTDPNEVFLYVPLWHKFNELIFVLGASLLDIGDRWADGKGPLALHFRPYELKQLIRALFQNSDRRAAVLSRIHE